MLANGLLRVALLAWLATASWAACAWAQSPLIELPAGETVVDLAWSADQSIVMLVEVDGGYALRRCDVNTGEISVISAPRGFTRISAESRDEIRLSFFLAASGTTLAVLENAVDPLVAPEFSVYRITAGELRQVSVTGLPVDFWVEHATVADDGGVVFVSAQHYLFPDQKYSIGRIDVDSGRFSSVALKANVDLVNSLISIPGRGALAVRARSYRGEYPEHELIVLVEERQGQTRIIHADADDHRLIALADGTLVITEPLAEVNAQGSYGHWMLAPDKQELESVYLAASHSLVELQASADAKWLGLIAKGTELGVERRGDENYLVLQRSSDGLLSVTSEPCSLFVFSPDATRVCTANGERTGLLYFDLAAE
ncbi:hypothetical protein JW859_12945 [bacterium]|nr:hypothetical protein [bacterium]